MLKKLFGFLSNTENKKEEEKAIPPPQQTIDLSKYILYTENTLRIQDYSEELKELPDNFFEAYADIVSLEINVSSLASVPNSINALPLLRNLHISHGKFRSLPDISSLNSLEHFSISRNNLFDLNKELVKLAQLPKLQTLTIGSYKGKTVPSNIVLLKNCTNIEFEYGLEDKVNLSDLYTSLAQMHWLKKLKIDFYIRTEAYTDEFIKLDFLEEITLRFYGDIHNIPPVFGLLRHVNFDERNPADRVLRSFREKYDSQNLPDRLRKLLFCYYIKNFKEIKELLPNTLLEAFERKEKRGLVLVSKIKGQTPKTISDRLSSTSFYIAKPDDKGNLLYIVGIETDFEIIEKLVLEGKTLVFQEYLQELIIKLDDPWLLQKDNSGLNDQLLQLLASNQADNYKVAFEIIEGGGANKTIQALLAAIMLSHPDKTIAKSAERLYDKYGSALFKDHCKQNSSSSLRKSGSTAKKLAGIVKHPDMDEFVFRIMHHLIASNNPNIKDVVPHLFEAKGSDIKDIPEVIRFFGNITSLDFSACSNLNLGAAIPWLKQMTGLKQLWINGAHISIPSEIKELAQLEVLEADYNEFADVSALAYLVNLKQLNVEGCKIKSFEWLAHLSKMTHLNLNNNNLTKLPSEVHQLRELNTLTIKQNKFTGMDPNLPDLLSLRNLDYSNNAIVTVDYRYFGAILESLLLRSNKIEEFDWKKIKELGINSSSLNRLNLAGNNLKAFSFGSIQFSSMNYLDISNNKITILDSSIFQCPIRELYASKNLISDIPDNVAVRSHYTRIWLQDNQIKELKESFSKLQIDNCDLSSNKIEKLHPNFEIKKEKDYSRLYWKMKNNPISKELKGIAGLYGH